MEEGKANILVWADEENRLAFNISSVFGEEKLVKMTESMRAAPWDMFFRPGCRRGAMKHPPRIDRSMKRISPRA